MKYKLIFSVLLTLITVSMSCKTAVSPKIETQPAEAEKPVVEDTGPRMDVYYDYMDKNRVASIQPRDYIRYAEHHFIIRNRSEIEKMKKIIGTLKPNAKRQNSFDTYIMVLLRDNGVNDSLFFKRHYTWEIMHNGTLMQPDTLAYQNVYNLIQSKGKLVFFEE